MMFALLASAALAAAASSDHQPIPVVAQARASVRIISGVKLKLDSPTNEGAPPAHDGKVITRDGAIHPARLIEFE